jgi:hypothetical protein
MFSFLLGGFLLGGAKSKVLVCGTVIEVDSECTCGGGYDGGLS